MSRLIQQSEQCNPKKQNWNERWLVTLWKLRMSLHSKYITYDGMLKLRFFSPTVTLWLNTVSRYPQWLLGWVQVLVSTSSKIDIRETIRSTISSACNQSLPSYLRLQVPWSLDEQPQPRVRLGKIRVIKHEIVQLKLATALTMDNIGCHFIWPNHQVEFVKGGGKYHSFWGVRRSRALSLTEGQQQISSCFNEPITRSSAVIINICIGRTNSVSRR